MSEDGQQENKSPGKNKEINRIRGKWLEGLQHREKVPLAFKLEMHLKALDRFFNIQNLPLPEPQKAITLNFVNELHIVQDYINRVIDLSRELMEAARGAQVFQFRSYVETTLLGDVGRTRIREASYEQKSPNDSLFLLYTAFANIRGILRALIRTNRITYPLFVNVGNLISREIISNRFFNPVKEIEFRPEFDRIENRKISRLVMRIQNENLRRHFSAAVLLLFRLLRYLEHIDPATTREDVLKGYIPIFALIRSESVQLKEYLEKGLPNSLPELEGEEETHREEFLKAADALAFQLSMETKKIFQGELLNTTRTKDVHVLRSAVENSHGILSNFFRQSIIQLVKVYEPHIEGRDIFPSYTSKLRQSLQLRSDLFVFKELMDRFEEQAETNPEEDTASIYVKYFRLMKDYILYLRHESYHLLRYDDMRQFDEFFDFMDTLEPRDIKDPGKRDEFIYKSKYFKIFLETTLSSIELRSELKSRPIDYRACERFLKQFILASMRRQAKKMRAKKLSGQESAFSQ